LVKSKFFFSLNGCKPISTFKTELGQDVLRYSIPDRIMMLSGPPGKMGSGLDLQTLPIF